MIRIEVVTAARTGFVLAVDTSATPGTAQVVGQVHRSSIDGEAEAWKAWLWEQPGRYPPTSQHTQAITAKGKPSELREALRRRHAAKGAWWA
jgi:hypothetical protein